MASILVVDDSTLSTRTLVEALRRSGYDVEIAPDADEAVRLFKLNPVDAVVMDCHVEASSQTIAPVLRQIYPDTPIIMMSGYCGVPCKRLRAADGCVQKGDTTALLDALRTLLCSRHYGLCQSVAA